MEVTSTGLNSALTNSIASNSKQIASGKQVNTAADSPAAIALIAQFNSQISGNSAAQRNILDGTSALQVAQGGLSQITDSLQQLRELGLQSANGTLNPSDKASIQKQADELLAGISDTLQNNHFNEQSLINNNSGLTLQSGANSDQQQVITSFDLTSEFSSAGLFDIDFTTDSLSDTLESIDAAINLTDTANATFGAAQNRLDSTSASLNSATINQASALSQIEDTDYAAAISEQTKLLLQRDVEIALLGQANAQKGQVLQLLKPI
jgi:flagellin